MLNITEMRDLIKETGKDVQRNLDATKGHFDYLEANIFGTGTLQDDKNILTPAKCNNIIETLRAVPLREFLAKSGTTGIAGAAYLIPDKIYQTLFDAAVEEDIVAAVSAVLLGREGIPGSSLKVDISVDGSYVPLKFSSGGALAEEEIKTIQATLTPISWGINFNIGNDLIEDSQFDMIEVHIRNAGREMGEFATNEALTVLKTATDGDGTVNSGVSGNANETKWTGATTTDIEDAMIANIVDGHVPDTMVCSHGAMLHSIYSTVPAVEERKVLGADFPRLMLGLNVLYTECNTITNNKVGDDLVTLVFKKAMSMITARKRWLRIENYSDPIRDLVGATVTARQDSITVYNDAIFRLTET